MVLSKATRISIMLGIDSVFLVLELGTGIYVGSLALMADAFHMLNDIISLSVGLWAVKAVQQSSTDKYSFGMLRAEILGAFFNAVFLIALCLTIFLEAIQRLIAPPKISNPVLITIVGSLGLLSNVAGFLILGGHGHSHGAEEHDHGHGDEVMDAEEGHRHSHDHGEYDNATSGNGHGKYGTSRKNINSGPLGDIYPEAVIARAKRTGRHLQFTMEDEDDYTNVESPPNASRQHQRKNSSIRNGRYATPDDFSIHPASFRKEIIAASKPHSEGFESEETTVSEDEAISDGATENSPLLTGNRSPGPPKSHGHHHEHSRVKPRDESWHVSHNHNKLEKAKKGGHGHSHDDMGMNAMILHVIGDALGNVGVIASALVIWLTNWSWKYYADPAVSLFIAVIILRTTVPLTIASAQILLQATPDHINISDIKEDIQALPGVLSCHHVHIWQLSGTKLIASLHIQVEFSISEANREKYMEIAKAARSCLHEYGIHSATIQPEFCVDKSHDHSGERPGAVGLDGIVGQVRCGLEDDDTCLLECVDDCRAKGCCSSKAADSQHDHHDHTRHPHSH
ncbi:cation diffusion facilitator family transporter [Diplocarpon rosae]|nr:cation diffusion facilitator family transporter [Diplocarpon rosae]